LAGAASWQAAPALRYASAVEAALTLLQTIRADPNGRALCAGCSTQPLVGQTVKAEVAP
jgi:hypothetical protein